jgi:hypothetical protein
VRIYGAQHLCARPRAHRWPARCGRSRWARQPATPSAPASASPGRSKSGPVAGPPPHFPRLPLASAAQPLNLADRGTRQPPRAVAAVHNPVDGRHRLSTPPSQPRPAIAS